MSITIINPPGSSTPTTTQVPQRPNLLRNSGFWFAQCQAPATLTTLAAASPNRRNYGPDGWYGVYENVNVQYARVDTDAAPEAGIGGRYYGRFVKITNAGKVMICQAVESVDCQQVRGTQVRVQIKLKASAASTWRLGLLQLGSAGTVDTIDPQPSAAGTVATLFNGTGTDPTLTVTNNIAYIAPDATNTDNTTVVGNALNCSVTTAWQRFGGTFTVPTDCHNLIVAVWSDAQMAVSDEIKLTEACLCANTDIVTWAPLPYDAEFQRCQRFILKTFAIDTAPAQNAAELSNALQGIAGKSGASAFALFLFWRFPVPMFRDGLTDLTGFPLTGVTRYNPSAANTTARNLTAGADMGAVASIITRRNAVVVQVTGVGGGGSTSVGDQCALHLLIFGEL